MPEEVRGRARIVQKQPGVVYGLGVVAEVLRQCGVEDVDNLVVEGQWREEVPVDVAFIGGPAAALFAAERTALNFLCHLSGVATLTASFVAPVERTGAASSTRARPPRACVRWRRRRCCRGREQSPHGPLRRDPDQGEPRRYRGRPGRGRPARAARPDLAVEVECRNLDEVAYALGTGADRLLLDNMEPASSGSRAAARRNTGAGDRPSLEASGGVNLGTVRTIAETGVDYISVGALTHSAPALDFSMLIEASCGASLEQWRGGGPSSTRPPVCSLGQ